MMAGKEQIPSYTALVRDVVRKAEAPIPVMEIMRRVHQLRSIETRSPESTIRNAISQLSLPKIQSHWRELLLSAKISGSLQVKMAHALLNQILHDYRPTLLTVRHSNLEAGALNRQPSDLSGRQLIAMMEPSDLRKSNDLTVRRRIDFSRRR